MQQKIYILVGVPASGKSWVASQLKDQFNYIPHDKYMHSENAYLGAVISAGNTGSKPVLMETPFSLSKYLNPLMKHRFSVHPIFIIENPKTIANRYSVRERKDIPEGHITRNDTYLQRANELKAFYGTSDEVLNHLKSINPKE